MWGFGWASLRLRNVQIGFGCRGPPHLRQETEFARLPHGVHRSVPGCKNKMPGDPIPNPGAMPLVPGGVGVDIDLEGEGGKNQARPNADQHASPSKKSEE